MFYHKSRAGAWAARIGEKSPTSVRVRLGASIYSSDAPNNCRRLKPPNCSCMWASVCAFSSANLIHFSAIKRRVAAASGSEVFRAASTHSAVAALDSSNLWPMFALPTFVPASIVGDDRKFPAMKKKSGGGASHEVRQIAPPRGRRENVLRDG